MNNSSNKHDLIIKRETLCDDSMPTANKALPKAGLYGFDWTFVHISTAVILLISFAKYAPHRQAE